MPEEGFSTAGIIGVGLIGGSLALALKRKNSNCKILGFGRNERRLKEAKELGIIDEYSTLLKEVAKADLIVFATPLGLFEEIARELVHHIEEEATVIDVGSVKGSVVKVMEEIFDRRAHFVGTHPIAGSEKTGFENAKADLFENAKVIITPTEKTNREALKRVISLWQTVGALVEIMTPEEHDRVYALVSHLPHLVAFSLVNTVAEVDRRLIKYAGSGFRDTTRIGKSSPEIWSDIFSMNKKAIIEQLEVFSKQISLIRHYLESGELTKIYDFIKSSKELREKID